MPLSPAESSAGTKKRLKKLVAAVSTILDDQTEARKLKKAEALERFIVKLEDKHREMEAHRQAGAPDPKQLEEHADRAKSLAKQIKKARKILADIKDKDGLPGASSEA